LKDSDRIGIKAKTQYPQRPEKDWPDDEWILWEYACCHIEMNANAIVETVSKSFPPDFAAALGIDIASPAPPKAVSFIALAE